jgi:phage terminase large subunit-like protein
MLSRSMEIDITPEDIALEIERRKYRKKDYFFPDHGVLSYKNYTQHTDFLYQTSEFRESAFMAANRAGKSETGAYAVTCWLTGEYPHWWRGKRFDRKVNILVCGETGKLVRDSLQKKLLGEYSDMGSGMIPKENIVMTRPKSGIPDAVDYARIRGVHGESILQFMSYDQGRHAFQATERDVVWEDEEPPLEVHTENCIRTMTTGGIVLLTFTPLKGLSDTVLSLQQKQADGICSITSATWDDAPHLTEKDKKELMDSLPPFQRDARSKGIPQLGAGAVYPVREDDVVVEPFPIPAHYRCAYGLDVGWNNTAAIWIAHDTDTDVIYIWGEYKQGQAEPAVHAAAINARGRLPGFIDPASAGSNQVDGRKVVDLYRAAGLEVFPADNTVEAGIFDIYGRMTTGRLKIFSSCTQILSELRIYRRDEKGKIVKQNDHLLDALRYVVRSGLLSAVPMTETKPKDPYKGAWQTSSWMEG